jgi:hypothetical protein
MSKQNKRGGKGDKQTLEFHTLISAALAAGVFQTLLNPSQFTGTRLATEADVWAHFRFRKLSFRLRVTPSTSAQQFAGFAGGVQDTPPGTAQAVMELIPSCMIDVDQTVPSEWVNVRQSELAGCFPWYKSVVGAADPTEEAPGVLCIVGTGTEVFGLEVRGVLEFKTAVAVANTPLSMQARNLMRAERLQMAREREARVIRQVLDAPRAATTVTLTTSSLTK